MQFAIGNVNPGHVDSQFMESLLATLDTDVHGAIIRPILTQPAKSGMVHLARTLIVRKFLATSADYLLFIDSDMTWDVGTFWNFYERLCAGCYPILSAHTAFASGDLKVMSVQMDERLNVITHTEGIHQVFCTGTGFVFIHRDVFGALSIRHEGPLPWFDYGLYRGLIASEDLVFADRCKAADIPAYVDAEARVGQRQLHTFMAPVPKVSLTLA